MNILLLIAFIVTEVGFLVYTLTENRKKSIWTRNRLIVDTVELLTYLLFVLFPGVDMGFRFKPLIIILIIRLILAGIVYLTKRRSEGIKKTASAIVSSIIGIIILSNGLILSFLFTDYEALPVSGGYNVAFAEAILTDDSRLEEFETDGSHREVPIHIYFPDNAGNTQLPVIFFSHGSFGYYKSNHSTYTELASNGYVVVSLDHPYHAFTTKDTSGKTINVDINHMQSALSVNSPDVTEEEIVALSTKWLKLRSDDINFVIDTVKAATQNDFTDSWYFADEENKNGVTEVLKLMNTDKIALMGHSLGGAAAVKLGRERNDISAVVDLDGTMLSEQKGLVACEPFEFDGKKYDVVYDLNTEPYPIPILNIDNEAHHNDREKAREIGMPYANNALLDNAVEGYSTYFKGAGHLNYTDLPLFSPFLAKALGTGSIDKVECITEMNSIVLDFCNYTLKDTGTFTLEEFYGN